MEGDRLGRKGLEGENFQGLVKNLIAIGEIAELEAEGGGRGGGGGGEVREG